MSKANIFIPEAERARNEQQSPQKTLKFNAISNILIHIARWFLVAVIGLFPLVFLTGTAAPRSFEISLFVIFGISAAAVLAAIASIWTSSVRTQLPMALCALFGFGFLSFLSVFSHEGSFTVLWGRALEPLTFAFTMILIAAATAPLLLQGSTKMIVRTLSLVGIVMAVIVLHTAIKFWFGISIDFGAFNSATESFIGGFNDTAIYAGLVLCGALVSSLMLPLRQFAQIALLLVCVVALAVLMVVNFEFLWIVLTFVSGVTALYVGLRQFSLETEKTITMKLGAVLLPTLVFLVSASFALFGPALSGAVVNITGVEFLEVRPSLESTIDVAQGVYEDNLFFGVGPNQFDDAWRMFKDLSINETVFWDADFTSGFSYVSSIFVTHGLLAGLALVLFHVAFVIFGIRRLTEKVSENVFARFVITLSFVSAVYLWTTTYFYMPGVTILLLAAFFTGLTYAANSLFQDQKEVTIPLATNRIAALVVTAGVVLFVCLAVYTVFVSIDRAHVLNNAVESELETNDPAEYARLAGAETVKLNQLIVNATPETVSQEDLLSQSQTALAAARVAVEMEPENPLHYMQLATLYTTLGRIGVTGGYESAIDTLTQVLDIDARNPKHHLALAQLYVLQDEQELAKESLATAIDLKSNYTRALQLQAEITVAEGNVDSAIEQLESVIQLNQSDPALWYQLGTLYSANDQSDLAIAAFTRAVVLQPQYADARFALAIEYVEIGDTALALEQLRIIEQTNPDSEILANVINQIENPSNDGTVDISEVLGTEDFTGSGTADSDFVVPVNTTEVTE